MNQVQKVRDNIDPRIVTSAIVAAFILGGMTYIAARSGIKPLQEVAKAVK